MARLLEVSISTEHILKDMALYAELGFQERTANETVTHHYGVLGDTDFSVGLHVAEFASPTLTYVLPNVARYASLLEQLNIEIERADLSDDQFNQISFFDPGAQRINLIEARTFSPAFDDEAQAHQIGQYQHVELPHSPEREAFWERLQEIVNPQEEDAPFTPMIQLRPSLQRLTAIYESDLEALIVHSAQQGWQHFSVTQDDHGLYRTPHQFDIRVASQNMKHD